MTVQLQILKNGNWQDVGRAGLERVKPGGGSANRASARVECIFTRPHEWRSVIDVDLVGYADSPEKLVTPARNLNCEA